MNCKSKFTGTLKKHISIAFDAGAKSILLHKLNNSNLILYYIEQSALSPLSVIF